ncbi:MAG: flagellar M-ring protein FliF [Alphaproteobacteria bacterium]|nr:flagellar M-ring protein FliF [Alphaproteobacteria bacterium]MBU1526127.1 flagellar M-ring protein FliF [Alphaproteobacteria bacterium]MBU2350236.1 flagellar M-ring protein FliF [Alphaproteobacteria bacterium]MBU2381394.1 flagellar M-ring protein FliF [Alphaproteobacteria bacterium]
MGGFSAAVQRFGVGRLAAVLGVAAGVAAVLVAVMLRIGQAPDALLYSNLDLREASEITTALDSAGIKYSSKGDGSTIFVSRDEVGTARMLLAGKGLVTQGSVGYEIFDEQSVLGQTEFQQNLNAKRALEGELARDIMSLRGVSMARVRIALPERALFQAQAAEPTASVVVGLGGREMTAENVRAIRNLVASAVPNMKPNRVTVVDDANRTLAAGGEDDGFGAGAEQAKAGTERQLQARIMDIVEGVVGPGAARVQVTAEIDHSRQTTQELRYDPDGQVVRSTATNGSTAQDTTNQALGGATATENIPGGEAPGAATAGSTQQDQSETINYEISNTTTTTIKEPGEVRRLAVAVAVDGKWTPGANGAEATYAARTPEEIAQIKALVAAAVGIDETRGDKLEVTNVRFDRAALPDGGTEAGGGMFDFGKNDIMRGVELLILLITGLLLIFFVLRPLLKAATGGGGAPGGLPALNGAGAGGGPAVTQLQTVTMSGGGAGMAQLTGPTEMEQRLDIARIEGQVKASSVRKVADFVEKHPEESTAILRNWVHEG